MRKLKHPIAVFIVAVLVVIGIGVGIVAVTTNQKVYGPSWGRFTAAFTGHIHVAHVGPVANASNGNPLRYMTTFYYANQAFNGWIAYAPLSGSIFPTDLRAVAVTEVAPGGSGSSSARRLVTVPAGHWFEAGVRKDEQVVDGLSVVTFGPYCGYGQCQAEMVVSNGRAVWDVLVSSKAPASTAESFLASFQPIG